MADFNDQYGFLDKLLHKFAFNTTKMQLGLAQSETEQHQHQIDHIQVKRPVFITGLPRAGTTILLEVLTKTQCFSYHSYQDMPFIFTPLIWRKFSGRYAKTSALTERAHHDGIKINQQSPEAFEEMFYKAHYPELYLGDSLAVEAITNTRDFGTFFNDHIKKLLWRDGEQKRYLSKNNLNISRLGLINRLFEQPQIVIPFRHPIQHALSLWRQHLNFSQLHQRNSFAKDYMAGVGHFDFGANLKPVNFNGWFEQTRYKPDGLDFWLEYWINCYQYLLDNKQDNCTLVCFEHLSSQPEASFSTLAHILEIEELSLLTNIGAVKTIKFQPVDDSRLDSQLLAQSSELYQSLLRSSLI